MKYKKFIYSTILVTLMLVHCPAWSVSAEVVSLCKETISTQEKQKGIPQGLLKAIAMVESKISPWAINAKGRAYIFNSKEAAVKHARKLVESGFRNFSVGCMQIHYASHRGQFKSLEDMFDPENNIAHAARLIKKLERRYGSLEWAVKRYHAPSPRYYNPYQRRVYRLWGQFRAPDKPRATPVKAVAHESFSPQVKEG